MPGRPFLAIRPAWNDVFRPKLGACGQDTSLNVGAGGIITGDINPMMRPALALARLILTNPQITWKYQRAVGKCNNEGHCLAGNKQSVAKSLTLNGSTLSFNRSGKGD